MRKLKRCIKIIGAAGKGIKFASLVLAKLLARRVAYVTFYPEYGSTVTGGIVIVDIKTSTRKISTPLIDEPDLLVLLKDVEKYPKAKEIIADKNTKVSTHLKFPFYEIGRKLFGDEIFGTMVAIGVTTKHLGISIENVEEIIPKKKCLNKKALCYGRWLYETYARK